MARFAFSGDHGTRSSANESAALSRDLVPGEGPPAGPAALPPRLGGPSGGADGAEFDGGQGAELAGARSEELVDEDELVRIDRKVNQLFALVENAIAGATHALVSADREAARALVAADAAIDELYGELRSLVNGRLLGGRFDTAEAQYLLAVLGMLPELERSGDLAEHVARRATRNLTVEIPGRLRGYIERMGDVACAMWRMAADSYAGEVPSAIERLEVLDDEMDDLHVTFIAELVTAGTPVVVAIELALVGRFYERLGDHAVNLARRVPSVRLPSVPGQPPQPDPR